MNVSFCMIVIVPNFQSSSHCPYCPGEKWGFSNKKKRSAQKDATKKKKKPNKQSKAREREENNCVYPRCYFVVFTLRDPYRSLSTFRCAFLLTIQKGNKALRGHTKHTKKYIHFTQPTFFFPFSFKVSFSKVQDYVHSAQSLFRSSTI